MLEPCWHYFSFLGAFCGSCCVCCRSWLVFVRLGTLLLDFGRFRECPGRVLEAPKLYFSRFFAHARMQCEKSPTGVLYWKNQYEMHVGHPAHNAKNKQNSTRTPVEQRFPPRSCYKLVLEVPGLGFGGVWVPRGQLLGALGRLLGSLGRLLAPLGSFLGASWTSLGRSWAHVVC